MSVVPAALPAHTYLQEPVLLFHPEREQDRDLHPLRGLATYGPYSRKAISQVMDPIRVAWIAPAGAAREVHRLLAELEARHQPRERMNYLIDFPGFAQVFGVRAVPSTGRSSIELPTSLDRDLARAAKPHVLLADHLTRALASLAANRTAFDVAVLLLPARWSGAFYGGGKEDFDLHDYLKATTATWGIPLQIVRDDSALTYFCRCSVMWRLGIALYTKAGGVPWKLADTSPDTAFVGIGYAVRDTEDRNQRFVTCCSQVFDADGVGLEFLVYDATDVRFERENPYLSRGEMCRLMLRTLNLYQRRHGGRVPKNVVVHKSTPFMRQEADGCFDAWSSAEGLELIQVQQDSIWKGIQIAPSKSDVRKGEASAYPCLRGSFLPLGGRDVLIWTQGNAPRAAQGLNYFQEGKGVPSPLMLIRHAGHGAWDESCRAVIGLTKMNWNSDQLYERLPVTLSYASTLARTVKRMPKIDNRAYEFRYFM